MSATAPGSRIVSLDQFRGYTVAGMFLVNFLGGYWACPAILRHHNTFISYADTIMPHFLFAVGFAFRLTFGRRVAAHGAGSAYFRVVKRLLGLMLVAFVVYTVGSRAGNWQQLTEMGFWGAIQGPLKSTWFQTLMHIAATSLWILPVIRYSIGVRLAFMIASAGLHVYLSHVFYFDWVNVDPRSIDGGPLGFLSWSVPALIGTITCDAVAGAVGRPRLGVMTLWSIGLMLLGYGFSCGSRLYDVPEDQIEARASQQYAESPVLLPRGGIRGRSFTSMLTEPPFVRPPNTELLEAAENGTEESFSIDRLFMDVPPKRIGDDSYKYRKWNYWMMSQRAGSISYMIFSAGLSVLLYVLFYIACDIYGLQIGFFRTFGTNAMVGYVLHGMVDSAISPFVPRDAPGWYMYSAFLVFMWITYVIVRNLEKNGIYVKL